MLSTSTRSSITTDAHAFQSREPFKFTSIDNFLDEKFVTGLIEEFPIPDRSQMLDEYGRKSNKHTVTDVGGIGGTYAALDEFAQSNEFLEYMEHLTGIDDLLFDSSYFGGGTHNNLSGQGMDPHVDFNILESSDGSILHRRINAILYLNEQWSEDWGGVLELHSNPYQPDINEIENILPIKNRLVVFETSECSWHGFKPVTSALPEGVSRKSFAIYLYTKTRPRNEIASKHGTFYVPRIELDEPLDLPKLKRQRQHALFLIRETYNKEKHLSKLIEDREWEIKQLKRQLPAAASYVQSEKFFDFQVSDWGPRSFDSNALPNLQPDGSVGFWARLNDPNQLINPFLLIDNQILREVVVDEDVITALLPAQIVRNAAAITLTLIDPAQRLVLQIGSMIKENSTT